MSQDVTLIVDLDHSLIRTDLLYETFFAATGSNVGALFSALLALGRGRVALKAHLADRAMPDVRLLPYNEAVLEHIRAAREAGGKVALVSASDQRLVEAVANHLELFDEVFGSGGGVNLKGEAKAAFLCERYGEGNFDYIGDSRADLAIWKKARRAITVGAGGALKSRVDRLSQEKLHLDPPASGRIGVYLRALRPHQWSKNLLLALPLIAAHEGRPEAWAMVALAFIAFSLVASSVYVLNDCLDLEADRAHPRKCHRPFAAGTIPLRHGLVMAPGLLLLGFLVALLPGQPWLPLVLLAYYALTLAYSLHLKRKLVIDICTLAGLYTLRMIGGGAAAALPISPWMMAFSVFLFFSLAAMKRQAELVDGLNAGRETAAGRAYRTDDLNIVAMMALASGYVACLVLALYIDTSIVKEMYSSPYLLWGVCPVLLYWVSRVVMMAHRGSMHDDPIVFAVKDRTSLLCGGLVLAIFVTGSFL